VGVFLYRLFNLWLPLVPALLAMHATRGREPSAAE
jgi:hypothetical protein